VPLVLILVKFLMERNVMKTVTLLILTSLLFAFASYGGGTSSCCLAVAAGDSPGLAVWELTNGIANEGAGIVYVADADGDSTRAAVVSTLDGAASRRLGGIDATGAEASFTHPSGVAADGAGNIYVADFYGYTVRQITRAGEVSTLAGATGLRGSTDAAGAAARFSGPRGVAIDSAGNVYVADANNSTIRKITSAGEVSTFAGAADSFPGNTDATGAAARFFAPEGIAIDSADNLYVADTNNNTIRKITPVRVVTTFAGSTEGRAGTADGTGAAARFFHPEGVAIDRAGNLYVADRLNYTIRKITPAGVVTTLAGSTAGRAGSADGTGAAARFNTPLGLATDSAGNVYVADHYNSAIRKITPVVGVAR